MSQPSYAEGAAVARDGELLRYRVYGGGASAPMLLYNGLVSSGAHWPFFVGHFAPRRRVVFWDYRGHGGQRPPRDLESIAVESFAASYFT